MKSEQLVCQCLKISYGKLQSLLQQDPELNLEGLMKLTGAGGQCGTCIAPSAKGKRKIYLADLFGRQEEQAETAVQEVKVNKEDRDRPSYLRRILQVQGIIAAKVRPVLVKDGGDIELVALEGNQVLIEYQGACAPCPSSKKETLAFIQDVLAANLGNRNLYVDYVE